MKEKWQSTAVLLLAVLVVGYILGRSGVLPGASAQSAGAGDRIAVVMGSEFVDDRVPFVVVDPLEETIMLYEWDVQARSMYMRAIRSYRYDKMVNVFGNANTSPSPREVQRQLQRGG